MTTEMSNFLVMFTGATLLLVFLVGLYAYYREQKRSYNPDDLDLDNDEEIRE